MYHLIPTFHHLTKVSNSVKLLLQMSSIVLSGCVVPSFLHRVYNRCTEQGDRSHHIQLMKNVLKHRSQNMTVILNKFEKFHASRHRSHVRSKEPFDKQSVTSITFDAVSKVHLYTENCIKASYKHVGQQVPHMVFTSFPKMVSRLSSKRTVLGQVKEEIARRF